MALGVQCVENGMSAYAGASESLTTIKRLRSCADNATDKRGDCVRTLLSYWPGFGLHTTAYCTHAPTRSHPPPTRAHKLSNLLCRGHLRLFALLVGHKWRPSHHHLRRHHALIARAGHIVPSTYIHACVETCGIVLHSNGMGCGRCSMLCRFTT